MARLEKKTTSPGRRVRLRPADPFELIRWLARSQSDPRKAIAELVQNSLDAGARHIDITRHRVGGVPLVLIRDDGDGVIPELSRDEALQFLATHIGHSRKLGLTPAERHARVVAGKYGVGLLGFWSVGKVFEIRTRIAGSELMTLRLQENKPTAHIERLPTPLDAPATYTEIVVSEIFPSASRLLSGRRLCDYLAAELRGQLLAHEVELTITDRQARGMAQKHFRVVPRRFVGEPLRVPEQIDVSGFAPARVELYVSGEQTALQVACAGTLVADDIAALHTLGVDHDPWVGRGVSGMIDFPDFTVPPGTRRGVSLDEAAQAFVAALGRLQPAVEVELERLDAQQAAATDREVVRELRRALRGFRRRLPQYELPVIEAPGGEPGDGEAPGEAIATDGGGAADPVELFPPGPLAAVTLQPDPVRVRPGGEHRIRAVPVDADGRTIRSGVEFTWRVTGAGLTITGDGARPALQAAPETPPHQGGRVYVDAAFAKRAASAEAAAYVVAGDDDDGRALGVPEPEMPNDPAAPWRSRMENERWQVNAGHEDYISLQEDARGRVRYLLLLLAKELVLRSYGRPGDGEMLDRVIEILAHAERNLRGR